MQKILWLLSELYFVSLHQVKGIVLFINVEETHFLLRVEQQQWLEAVHVVRAHDALKAHHQQSPLVGHDWLGEDAAVDVDHAEVVFIHEQKNFEDDVLEVVFVFDFEGVEIEHPDCFGVPSNEETGEFPAVDEFLHEVGTGDILQKISLFGEKVCFVFL